MPFDISTAKPLEQAKKSFDISTAKPIGQQASAPISAPPSPKESSGFMQDALNTAGEFAAGANRAAVGAIDFLGTPIREPANLALGAMGSDYRVPTLRQSLSNTPASVEGGFMQEGLVRDVVRAAGESAAVGVGSGAALRGIADSVPNIAANANRAMPNIIRSLGGGTAATDLAVGATSGAGSAAGAQYGKDIGGANGEMIGGLVGGIAGAPLGFLARNAASSVEKNASEAWNAISGGKDSAKKYVKSLFSDSAKDAVSASTKESYRILDDALIKSGLSAREAAKGLKSMGENGTIADVHESFSQQLNAAKMASPELAGHIQNVFNSRASGSYQRMQKLTKDYISSGKDIDEVLSEVSKKNAPIVSELYKKVNETPINLSERLRSMMEGDNPLGKAAKQANKDLVSDRIMGKQVGTMSLIDETKKVLDGQIGEAIRKGNANTVRRLTELKNFMVAEADAASPEYKEARQLAGSISRLKEVADLGFDFYKMPAREVKSLVEGLGATEKEIYKLSAMRSQLDRLDASSLGANSAKSLMSKSGDLGKLETLFDTKKEFKKYLDKIELEGRFKFTQNAVLGGSQTAEKLESAGRLRDLAEKSLRLVTSSPLAAAAEAGDVAGKLASKKGSQEFQEGLIKAGYLLSEAGLDDKILFKMLKNGETDRINAALQKALPKLQKRSLGGVIGGVGSQQESSR